MAFMGGGLTIIFGMTRCLQVFLATYLVNLVFPGHTNEFLKVLYSLQGMEFWQTDLLYHELFEMHMTHALNMNFQQYGYETKNFMYLTGAISMFGIIIVVN